MNPSIESSRTFTLSRRSILDTLFLSKTKQDNHGKPAYATITDGSVTILWRIGDGGRLSEVARILWPASSNDPHQLLVNGQLMLVDNVLQHSKSILGSNSCTFAAGTTRCKWKRGRMGHKYVDFPAWTCYENTNSTMRFATNGTSSLIGSKSLSSVALFVPPQSGLVKSELTIYSNGLAIMDHIVLTTLLICARKGEWRTSQSHLTHRQLESSLRAENSGSLPPYRLATPPSFRVNPQVNPSARRRRPHTANPAVIRNIHHPAPPPYTTIDDLVVRHSGITS